MGLFKHMMPLWSLHRCGHPFNLLFVVLSVSCFVNTQSDQIEKCPGILFEHFRNMSCCRLLRTCINKNYACQCDDELDWQLVAATLVLAFS